MGIFMYLTYNVFWTAILISLFITLIHYKKAWSYIENLRLNKQDCFFIALTMMIVLVFIYLGWSYTNGTKPTFEFFTAVGTIGAAWAATYGAYQASKIAKEQVLNMVVSTTLERMQSFQNAYDKNIVLFSYNINDDSRFAERLRFYFYVNTNTKVGEYYKEVMICKCLDIIKKLISKDEYSKKLVSYDGVLLSLEKSFIDILDLDNTEELSHEYQMLIELNKKFVGMRGRIKYYERKFWKAVENDGLHMVENRETQIVNNNLFNELKEFVRSVDNYVNMVTGSFNDLIFLISERYFDFKLIEKEKIDKSLYCIRNYKQMVRERDTFLEYLEDPNCLKFIQVYHDFLNIDDYIAGIRKYTQSTQNL